MPNETRDAVIWALDNVHSVEDRHAIVDLVAEYFNENDIEYGTFMYSDIEHIVEELRD